MSDPWQTLRQHTAARIGLGRCGDGLPTDRLLEFQLAHARARDSVHTALDLDALAARLESAWPGLGALHLESRCTDRAHFLTRPDLGRGLAPASEAVLDGIGEVDLVVCIADGLSARAVEAHAPAVVEALRPLLAGWRLAPFCLVRQGRVAIADAIGERLGAELSVILLGERPGLSAADSLGVYVTWQPRSGRTNAERNCISNVRTAGLPPADAAAKLAWLLTEASRRGLTGVALKDEAPDDLLTGPPGAPA